MPASKEHRLFKRLLPFLIGISLFAFAVLPAEANAGFFDSILGTSKSPYKGATPTPKPSPKVKSVAQKQKSPRPQVAKKIDLPSIQLPKLNIGRTLASIGDALWPFDDVKATKTVAKKEFGGKQVGQVLGEKDSKGPGLLSKFFKGVGNVVAGVLDFLWPFDGDDKKGLAKKDGKGKAAVSPSPAGVTQPKAGDEVVTELAQTGEEDSSSALVAIPEEVAKLTITEKLTVGDDSSDRLILKALLGSDILVDTTKTYNLGSGSGRFKDGYFSNNIYVGEENRIGATGMNVKGPMYLETRSGGSLYLLPDSQNVYIGTDTQTGHLTVANNLTVKGTLSTTSGASLTPDSLDITPATNIDALDIIGTNITTASLIDLDPTGTTSGNIIDIDTSTAHSGHVISVDNTGNAIWTGNIIDVDTGTGDASGDVINIAIEAGATDVQGIVMTNAAATDQAGWLASVDASAAWTANAINFLQSAGISTADVLAYDNSGNTATTGDFISFASGTGDADGDVFDITVELGATSTQIFDVNNAAVSDEAGWLMEVDTTGAWTGNAVDITTGAQAWTGNVVDINFGNAAATGDVVNIDIPALAVAVQNLVVTNAAASSTAGWLASIAASGAWTANAINFDQTAGISTGDVLAYDNSGNTATTGDFISFASGTGDADGDVFDITVELGATSTQIFDVNNAAVSDEAGWLMEVDTTGAWTGNAIDFTTGAQAWTGNVVDINFGNAAATGDVVNIDIPALAVGVQNLVVTNAAASSTAGWLASVAASGAWTANAINFDQTGGISTADVLAYDNSGNTATTGDFISFASGTGDADGDVFDITVELGATSTQIFDVNNAAVSDEAGWLMEVDTTGAWTGNAVDITTGAQAWTGNVVDINFGNAAATGDVVNIDIPALAVAVQNLVVTNAAASSTAGWLASVAASGAWTANAINFDQTAGISTADVLAYDNTGNTATTGDFISFASGTGDADGDVFDITVELGATSTQIFDVNNAAVSDEAGWLMEVDTTGAWTGNMIDITTGAQIWTANMIDINVGAAAATGDIINIALGADAPAVQALVVTGSSSTATGGVVSLAVNTAAAQSADIIDITSTVGIMDGSDTFQGIDVNITGANHTGASNVINGIAVDLTTPDADATETGVNIGANWDVGLSSATPVSFGGSMDVSTQDTFTDSDATPDVSGGSHFITNTTAVTITDFDAGAGTLRTGQVIFVESAGVITYDVTASGLNGGTTDLVTGAGDMTTWVYDGTDWNLTAWMDDSVIQAGGADLAEYFASHEILEPGDVVSADLANSGYVLKTAKAYESNLLGVVSTMPGLILGDPNDINQIALTGRVSVKVTNENGAIKAGDYLTSSSKAGYAMKATKAGPVVGMALADFDGQEGTVVTFVKATWFDPVEIQKQAVLAALGMGTYSSVYGGSVLGASTEAGSADSTGAAAGASSLIGPAADGSLGVLAEEVDLLVHGLLTASNLKVTTAAEFEGTLVVRGLATFEGDLVVKGALSLGSLDIAGALTKTMTAGSDLSAGDPVVISGANTVVRAGAGANVVGLAAHSAGAGSSVRVAVAGSVGGYSGLATGARYYVGPGGVVTTAPGGDRAVHIGIAISGSEMIVQIFEAAAPPAPPVVDTATVDPGPTVTVDSGSGGSGGSTSDTSSSPTSESSPTPTPEPSPVPESSPVPSPEPSVAPSPVPSGEPTPSPAP